MKESDKKRLKKILHLEHRIVATVSRHERPGYLPNAYGTFDHGETRARVLSLYRDLVLDCPSNENVRFLHAGALRRACDFDNAISAYIQLVSGGGNFSQLSRERLIAIYWHCGDKAQAQVVLDEFHKACDGTESEPLPLLVEQMFPS